MLLPLFCLSLANTAACWEGKKEGGESVLQPLVNDQRHMSRPTPETGGGTPQNHGLSEFKVVPERQGVGPRMPKPEVPKQQPATPDRTLYERFHGGRRRS